MSHCHSGHATTDSIQAMKDTELQFSFFPLRNLGRPPIIRFSQRCCLYFMEFVFVSIVLFATHRAQK